MRRITLAVAAATMSVPAAMTLPAAPASAVTYDHDGDYRGRTWRGRDGRYYCRRSDGTVGLIVGGAAGALIGREVAGRRGDRTLGAILGGAAGALVGREIQRGTSRRRCR